MRPRAKLIFAVACWITPAIAYASTTVGVANSNNCLIFACAAFDGATRYQQVYSASSFTRSSYIDTFTLFQNVKLSSPENIADTADFDVSFYSTPAQVLGLSTNGDANRGALLSNFGTFHVEGSLGPTLSFTGSGFNYDPSAGNLLMEVYVRNAVAAVDPAQSVRYASFQAEQPRGLNFVSSTSRFFEDKYVPSGRTDSLGVVTRFGAAPEPATWAMMIVGFGLAGGALRHSRHRGNRRYGMIQASTYAPSNGCGT